MGTEPGFGIHLYPYSTFPSLKAIIQFVKQAEELGYAFVNIPQHTVFPVDLEASMGQVWWDPFILANELGHATETIRLHFDIVILPQNNPFTLAKQIATLDHTCDGRVRLGVAPGWLESQFDILHVDFHNRVALMEEYLGLMNALWADGPSTFEGDTFRFKDVSFYPKPLQRPRPPIYIGGGVRASIRRAARLGDGWIPMPSSWSQFLSDLELLKSDLASAGRSLDGFAVFRTIPLFSLNDEVEEHHSMAGGLSMGTLRGDYGEAREYVGRCTEIGVTDMWVQLPQGEFERARQELGVFSRLVINGRN
jgi:probable F420-dependent oxidoreductase